MFNSFRGNLDVVTHLREMLAHDRFPHAVILAGPNGAGKYTLSQMIAKAMNCLEHPGTDGLPDFCGHCSNCVRIGLATISVPAVPRRLKPGKIFAKPIAKKRASWFRRTRMCSSFRPIPRK